MKTVEDIAWDVIIYTILNPNVTEEQISDFIDKAIEIAREEE